MNVFFIVFFQSEAYRLVNDLNFAVGTLCKNHIAALQWIPSHCYLHGNDTADLLAKEGSKQEQSDFSISFKEEKTIIKAEQQKNGMKITHTTRVMTLVTS